MGLDMYAITTDKTPLTEVDFRIRDLMIRNPVDYEFFYWRNHHSLHRWMEKLYRQKNGAFDTFNYNGLVVNSQDLNQLENDILENKLTYKTGRCLLGKFDQRKQKQKDLKFIREARKAVKNGNAIIYLASW